MGVFRRILRGTNRCQDLLACVFDLNTLETRAYFALLETPSVQIQALADALDRERSTTHRALQTLVNLDLAHRETVSMATGGYYHVYQPTAPDTVKHRIEQRLEAFDDAARALLDEFVDDAAPLGQGSDPPTEVLS